MSLSETLIKEFAKITNDSGNEEKTVSNIINGTVTRLDNDILYVTVDGSNEEIPVELAADAKVHDRVEIRIENHKATLVSNLSNPVSAYKALDTDAEVSRVGTLLADTIVANEGKFNSIDAHFVTTDGLVAQKADLDLANITNANVQNLVAGEIDAENITVKNINGNEITEGSILAAALSQEAIMSFGGNDIYYQATEPTGSFKDGDMWYKTVIESDKDPYTEAFYIYSNGSWTSTPLDATMLRVGSIVAANIASGTITSNELDIDEIFANEITASKLTVTGNSQIIGGTIGGFTIDSEKISVETTDGKKFELDSAKQSLSFEIKGRTSSQYMVLDKNGIEIEAYPSHSHLNLTPAFFEMYDGQGHVVGITPERIDVLDLYAVNINGKTPAYADDIPTPTTTNLIDGTSVNLASSTTASTLTSKTISAGTYIVELTVYLPSVTKSTAGRAGFYFNTSTSTDNYHYTTQSIATGGNLRLSVSGVVNLSTNGTLYIRGFQNSGASINANVYCRLTKIS